MSQFINPSLSTSSSASVSSFESDVKELSVTPNLAPNRKRKINSFQQDTQQEQPSHLKVQRTSFEEQITKIQELILELPAYWEWNKQQTLCEKIKPLLSRTWGLKSRSELHSVLLRKISRPENIDELQTQEKNLITLINQLDYSSNHPLLYELLETLIKNSQEELIKTMISKGLTLNLTDVQAQKCINAASHSNAKIAKLLLQPNMDISFGDGECANDFLRLAEKFEDIELANLVSICIKNRPEKVMNRLEKHLLNFLKESNSIRIISMVLEAYDFPPGRLLNYVIMDASKNITKAQFLFSKIKRDSYTCDDRGWIFSGGRRPITFPIVSCIEEAIAKKNVEATKFLLYIAGRNKFVNLHTSLLYTCIKFDCPEIYNLLVKEENLDKAVWDLLKDSSRLLKTDINQIKKEISQLVQAGANLNTCFDNDDEETLSPMEILITSLKNNAEVSSCFVLLENYKPENLEISSKYVEILKCIYGLGAKFKEGDTDILDILINMAGVFFDYCDLEGVKFVVGMCKNFLNKRDYDIFIEGIMEAILLTKSDAEFEFLLSQMTSFDRALRNSLLAIWKYHKILKNMSNKEINDKISLRLSKLIEKGANIETSNNGVPLFLEVCKLCNSPNLEPLHILSIIKEISKNKEILSSCDSNGFGLYSYSPQSSPSCLSFLPYISLKDDFGHVVMGLISSVFTQSSILFNKLMYFPPLLTAKNFDPFKISNELENLYEYFYPKMMPYKQNYLRTFVFNILYTWEAGYKDYIDSFTESVQNDNPEIEKINCIAEMKKIKNLRYGKRTLPKGVNTYAEFFKYFQDIIDCFEKRTHKTAIPQKEDERIAFYLRLETMLKFWIYTCINTEKNEYNPDDAWILMFNLVEVSQLCGTGWVQEIRQKYSMLTSKKVKTITEQIYTVVSCMRNEIITDWARVRSSQDLALLQGEEVHYAAAAITRFGRDWGVLTSNLVKEDLKHLNGEEEIAVTNYFSTHNKPSRILQTIKNEIKAGNINEDALIDVIKDTFIAEWKLKEFQEGRGEFLKELRNQRPLIEEVFHSDRKDPLATSSEITSTSQSGFKKLWGKIVQIAGTGLSTDKEKSEKENEAAEKTKKVVINLNGFKETIERIYNGSTSFDAFVTNFLPILEKGIENSRKDEFSNEIYDDLGKLKDEYLIKFLLKLKAIKFQDHLGMNQPLQEYSTTISEHNLNIQIYIKLLDRLEYLVEMLKDNLFEETKTHTNGEINMLKQLIYDQEIKLEWRKLIL